MKYILLNSYNFIIFCNILLYVNPPYFVTKKSPHYCNFLLGGFLIKKLLK